MTTLVGGAMGTVVDQIRRTRPARPLHPDGIVLAARLHRTGAPPRGRLSGADWLDRPGDEDAVVRLSRGAGLPTSLPDVHGLALAVPDGHLLLSTQAGRAPVLRHLPRLTRSHGRAAYGTLLPLDAPCGPVVVTARPTGPPSAAARALPREPDALAAELRRLPLMLRLSWAGPRSPWQPFALLAIMATADGATDPLVHFDPVRPPPGLAVPGWVGRLRRPAYARAHAGPAARPPGAAAGRGGRAPGPPDRSAGPAAPADRPPAPTAEPLARTGDPSSRRTP